MVTKTLEVGFGRVVLVQRNKQEKILEQVTLSFDSRHVYVGHQWRWSWKKDMTRVDVLLENNKLYLECGEKAQATCLEPTNRQVHHNLGEFLTEKVLHKHSHIGSNLRDVSKHESPKMAPRPRQQQPRRRYRRAYGKKQPQRFPTSSSSWSKTTTSTGTWSFSSDEAEQPQEDQYKTETKRIIHVADEEDDDPTNEQPQRTKKQRTEQDTKKRKRNVIDSDSDDDHVLPTLTSPSLVAKKKKGRVVSPPEEKQQQQEEDDTLVNKNTNTITQFFAKKKSTTTGAKDQESPPSSLHTSANKEEQVDDPPKHSYKSPFTMKEEKQPRKSSPFAKDNNEEEAEQRPLEQNKDWLQTRSSPRKSTPLFQPEDEIVSTPPRKSTTASTRSPPRSTIASRYFRNHHDRKTPIRRPYGSSAADLALNITAPTSATKRPLVVSRRPAEFISRRPDFVFRRETLPYAGLLNLGNTCYLNASVQALASVEGFVQDLQQRVTQLHDNNNDKNKLMTSLVDVFTKLGGGSSNNSAAVDPTSLKSAMDEHSANFLGHDQRDAHELMAELVDGLHEQELTVAPKKKKSVVDDHFCLQVKVSLTCDSCGYTRSMDEMYRHLSIDVCGNGNKEKDWSIELGLKQFFSSEERQVDCEKCKEGKTATQTLEVVKRPKVLLLHLKRFALMRRPKIIRPSKDESKNEEKENQPPTTEMTFRKNKARVEIPEQVSLDSFVKSKEETSSYKLISIVHHIGSTSFSGHYTADALRQDKWVTFDDAVTSYTQGRSNLQTAYMVLYG